MWWMTLLSCFVLSPVPDRASKLALDIVLEARAVLQQETSVSCVMCLRDSFLHCHYPNTPP